jgi:hypothetical protein
MAGAAMTENRRPWRSGSAMPHFDLRFCALAFGTAVALATGGGCT